MARVLAISSQVVRGHVGLSAMQPALRALGHEVWPLPTIILSNHPGHRHAAGQRIEPRALIDMTRALDNNGWLGEIDAIATGYFPSAEAVEAAAAIIARRRDLGNIPVLVDPVLGDEPKGLYVEEEVASAIRDVLVPVADLITPNRFELGWLTGTPIKDADDLLSLCESGSLPPVLATSMTGPGDDQISNLLCIPGADGEPAELYAATVERRRDVPHGTGDLLAGLAIGFMLHEMPPADLLGLSVAGAEQAIIASQGHDELQIREFGRMLKSAAAVPVLELEIPDAPKKPARAAKKQKK